MRAASALDNRFLEEAAEWLMRFSEGALSERELAQWQAWRRSHADAERAWQRAEKLLGKVGQLPPSLALPSLDRPADLHRRAALGRLAVVLALPGLAWAGWQLNEREGWTADYRSAVGQRRELRLADGSRLTLNTDTAVDVRFNGAERRILLRHGEILVDTASALDPVPGTLVIDTSQGRLSTQGGRFSLRNDLPRTHLVVLAGAVRIDLPSGAAATLQQQQRTAFSSHAIAPAEAADDSLTAWTHGMLMADNLRLVDLLGELGRYNRGFVRCDPALAPLRVSGAFPIDDRRRTLRMLALTYPIRIDSHLDGYWIVLSAA